MPETAIVISVAAVVLAPATALGATLLTYRLASRRFRHDVEETKWQRIQESYEKQIASAEKRGDGAKGAELRREYEGQLEAWRAQQDLEGVAPRAISAGGVPTLEPAEVERLRGLLAASAPLSPGALSAEDHWLRGNALHEAGQYEEALAAYDRSLALRPDDPEAHNNRGAALGNLGRHEESLAAHDRVLALWPDYPVTHSNRGDALAHLGRYEEALAAHDQALALRPDYPTAIYNKACAYSLMGDGESALEWLERAIAADKSFRASARTDEDFMFLRDHPKYGPRFRELVGE